MGDYLFYVNKNKRDCLKTYHRTHQGAIRKVTRLYTNNFRAGGGREGAMESRTLNDAGG